MVSVGVAFQLAPIAHADVSDDVFLNALTRGGITWQPSAKQRVITLGRGICKDWTDGATPQQVYVDAKTLGLNDHDTGVFVGAATTSYCPAYFSKALG